MWFSDFKRSSNLLRTLNHVKIWFAVFGIFLAYSKVAQTREAKTLEGKPSTLDVIRMRGFRAELYKVQSQGDTLALYRIINPLADPNTLNKYPVLYGHGILYDSMSMISRSEKTRPRRPIVGQPTIKFSDPSDPTDDNSLPFMLSNNNFDVWLFDARGVNDDNRNMTVTFETLSPEAQKFWDFSLDEQALLDLPLLIDYVLQKTASRKLVYVGYSESTFFMFALLSAKPSYADKIVAFVALAPVAYLAHIKGLTFPILAPVAAVPDNFHISFYPKPVLDAIDFNVRNFCQSQGLNKLICNSVISGIAGKGSSEFSPDFFAEFYKTTSARSVKQFIQLNGAKRFGMYDFGPVENVRKYGQSRPPNYDLSRIRSDRIIIARGSEDFLATPEDASRLIAEMGTKPFLDISVPSYNHFDFVDGKDLLRLVNGPVMIAIYQLMYKDGPNVIKDPQQVIEGRIAMQHTPQAVELKSPISIAFNPIEGALGNTFQQASNLFQQFLPIKA